MDLHDHTPTARGRAFMWGGILLGVLFVLVMYSNGFGLFGRNDHDAEESGALVRITIQCESSQLLAGTTIAPVKMAPACS